MVLEEEKFDEQAETKVEKSDVILRSARRTTKDLLGFEYNQ